MGHAARRRDAGPGLTVTTKNRPSASVGHRPNPEPVAGVGEPAVGAGLPGLGQGVGDRSPAPVQQPARERNAPGVPSGTTYGPSGQSSPTAKNGPTVCDGVGGRLAAGPLTGRRRGRVGWRRGPRRPRRSGSRALGLGGGEVEAGDQAFAGCRVGDGV